MRKRFLSLFLVLALCLACLPVQVHAAEIMEVTVTGVAGKYTAGNNVFDDLQPGLTVTTDPSVAIMTDGWGVEADGTLYTYPQTAYWENDTEYYLYIPIGLGTGDTFASGVTATVNGNPVDVVQPDNSTIIIRYPLYVCTDATVLEAPTAKTGLTFNNREQTLLNAGMADGGTFKYRIGSTVYDQIPTATNANNYQIYYWVEGDDEHFDTAEAGPILVTLHPEPVEIEAISRSVSYGATFSDTMLYRVASGNLYGNTLELDVSWTTPLDVNTPGDYEFEILSVENILPGPIDNFDITTVLGATTGTLTVRQPSSGGGGGGNDDGSYDFTPPKKGIGAGKADNDSYSWGERGSLCKDAATFYEILVENSVLPGQEVPAIPGGGSGIANSHFLTQDDTWTLPETDPVGASYDIDLVQVVQDDEPVYLDGAAPEEDPGKIDENSFNHSEFYTIPAGSGDKSVDYAKLKLGDMVRNTSFNGIFVTKLQKTNNANYDADLAALKANVIASFRAFELDHPEVFWLNGSIKLRTITVTIKGVQVAHIFMTLVDNSGFTMRMTDYANTGAIEEAIKVRDDTAAAIIAQIPADATPRQVIANLNKWFTLHNEYNRSADLMSIGYKPHRCLSALIGSSGTTGPVCEGYSKAFKLICDRVGIPCILDTGVAILNANHSEYHMWNRIQIDGVWYGMDCTWDDPVVAGKNGVISGYESEKFMLVGDETVIDGYKFGVSHPSDKTAGGTTGVLFASLMVNVDSIEGYAAMPFTDVHLNDWFYDYVKSAFGKQLMGGVADDKFDPQGTATRGQIVQILYNAAGQPAVDEVKVDGWFGKAATWAMEKGIVAGYPDGNFHGNDPVTREQLAAILWAYEGAPEQSGELTYADASQVHDYAKQALLWAKEKGIIGGKPGNLVDPLGTATRAEIATIFSNYMK